MNLLKAFALVLLISSMAYGQNKLIDEDLLGTWTAEVTQSKSQGMKMMFDKSTITFNADHSFTAKLMSGTWKISMDSIILDSEDTPGPMIFTDISADSCIWNLDELELRVIYYKKP